MRLGRPQHAVAVVHWGSYRFFTLFISPKRRLQLLPGSPTSSASAGLVGVNRSGRMKPNARRRERRPVGFLRSTTGGRWAVHVGGTGSGWITCSVSRAWKSSWGWARKPKRSRCGPAVPGCFGTVPAWGPWGLVFLVVERGWCTGSFVGPCCVL